MACLLCFCDRLDPMPGDHSCELPPGHAEACRCECEECLARLEVGTGLPGLAMRPA